MSDHAPNIDSVFMAALEIESPAERDDYLDRTCGDHPELRAEVEQMLAAQGNLGSFLEHPAADLDATILGEAHGDLAASMEAGLAPAFDADAAVVIGEAGHSVLKSLGKTVNIPRVLLRESAEEGADPVMRPTSPEMPKKNSDSRYQLQGEIARGGMGAILKGRDTDLGRDLAIKVLLEAHKDKPEVIERFVEEAQIGGQLQHPGIAPVYELGQFADRRPFFSMKLVKGETLSKLLADRNDPAEDRGRFIGIFEQICQTMAYAHSRGVIHRDLKPANIMVGAFGEVQVMDWGLAKVLAAGGVADEKKAQTGHQDISVIHTRRRGDSDSPGTIGSVGSQTQMGSVMGTPAYMPPEQALGEIDNLDERADVFGLGAILCEILTGKPPYVADDGTQVYRMASRGKLEDCFERLDGCGADEELIALTKNCLEPELKDRARDAGVLAERVTDYLESVETKLRETELERAAQAARADAEAAQANAERQRAEAESQRAESEFLRAQEERKRRRTSLALAAAVLLLVGVGSGGWLYLLLQEADRQTAEADAQRRHADEMSQQRQVAVNAQAAAEQAQQDAERERGAAVAARQVAEAAEEDGRKLLYATDMQLVDALLKDNESSARQILARLNAHDPDRPKSISQGQDLRGFEWYHFKDLLESQSTTFDGFEVPVVGSALTDDGELVTLDENAQVRRFDPTTRLETRPALDLKQDQTVQRTSLSADGRMAALAVGDNVHLVDTTTGAEILPPMTAACGVGLVFSPTGTLLITVDKKIIAWWDTTTGRQIALVDSQLDSGTVSVSADGLTIAVGCQAGTPRPGPRFG